MNRSHLQIILLTFVLLIGVASVHILMSFEVHYDYKSKEAGWTLTRDVILSLRSTARDYISLCLQHLAGLTDGPGAGKNGPGKNGPAEKTVLLLMVCAVIRVRLTSYHL